MNQISDNRYVYRFVKDGVYWPVFWSLRNNVYWSEDNATWRVVNRHVCDAVNRFAGDAVRQSSRPLR